jgi:hypothetical protein
MLYALKFYRLIDSGYAETVFKRKLAYGGFQEDGGWLRK